MTTERYQKAAATMRRRRDDADRQWAKATQPKETTMKITINGAAHETTAATITYEDVVKLAGMTGTPSMTWKGRGPHGGESSGIMHPGAYSIVPHEGLSFNVAHTGNA